MGLKHLVTLEEFMEAIGDDKLVVVDFYAQWCGPCRMIAPVIEDMAEEFKDHVVFYKVDVDKAAKEVVTEIRAMPTFIFYRKGEQLELFEGANSQRLRLTIENLADDSELPDSEEDKDE